ncbi:MAG: flagellar hook-basal body protein [Proteocatella sp.]
MLKGFYNLSSSMITQNRNLDVVSNNMVNVSTPGFKKDTMTATTFKEQMLARTGNTDRSNKTELNTTSMIVTAEETITNFSQGGFEQTGNMLHVALRNPGFFEIQTRNGNIYTRNGSFITDNEGYLTLPGVGRVVGKSGGPILLTTEDIAIDSAGSITDSAGNYIDDIRVVNFGNYDQINKNREGHIVGNNPVEVDGGILQGALERANVSMVDEMTLMMRSQRAIQSASQILKMYDRLMEKSTTEIGRV